MHKPSSWDLSEIIPSDYPQIFQEIKIKVEHLEKQRTKLNEHISIKEFLQLVQELEKLKIIISNLTGSAYLKLSEDSSNQKSLALMSKVENFLMKMNNRLLFFGLWFKGLPEEKSQELIRASGAYHYYFESLRKTKPYTLNENEEKIINLKDLSGVSALNNIYNILTSQFRYKLKGKEITQEELITKVRHPSSRVRKEAYDELLNKYKTYKDVIGEIYRSIVNDWREENIHLRSYQSPLKVRNINNDIPDEAVEILLKVCAENEHLFQRFFEIKRKRLGLKKLTRFDLYAPVKEKTENISYDDAVKLVLKALEQFSPQFKEKALKIINSKHIHSKIQENKQSGAFCYSLCAKQPPYILLSYNNTMKDVSTLAHELGHGIHHLLSEKQTEFTFHASLPLAETASIFSEMLLSEELIKTNPQKGKELIFSKIDDFYASIIRQAGIVRFELKAHQMMEEGKTMQEINAVYLADLKKQLGKKIKVDDLFSYEWCYIPHIFHSPFYCYAYAFGNLLTLALYGMYQENPLFKEKIISLLSQGGSASPLELTRAMGIDICHKEFWQKGFKMIEMMIEEIEA